MHMFDPAAIEPNDFFMVATSVTNDIVLIVMSEQKGWQHFRITFPRTACGLRFL